MDNQVINHKDSRVIDEYWYRKTSYVNVKVNEAFKEAQDHAYALGVARGKEDAKARYEPRTPLTDERVDRIGENMPGGVYGFLTQWGWRQFARAVEKDHGIED